MDSFLDNQSRVCLRMSEADRAVFAERFSTDVVKQHGAVMLGYVAIPQALLSLPEDLKDAFKTRLAYAPSLPRKWCGITNAQNAWH